MGIADLFSRKPVPTVAERMEAFAKDGMRGALDWATGARDEVKAGRMSIQGAQAASASAAADLLKGLAGKARCEGCDATFELSRAAAKQGALITVTCPRCGDSAAYHMLSGKRQGADPA